MADLYVAQTILEQLGSTKFRVMTGASNFVGHPDALSFRLPGGNKEYANGVNFVKITLTPLDTYTVEFSWVRNGKVTLVKKSTDIYAEDLRRHFTWVTGLETSLGTLGK